MIYSISLKFHEGKDFEHTHTHMDLTIHWALVDLIYASTFKNVRLALNKHTNITIISLQNWMKFLFVYMQLRTPSESTESWSYKML